MIKMSRLVALFCAFALITTACGDDSSDDAASDVSIVIALGSEPTSLDPHLVDDGGERAVNDNIYETLLSRASNGDLVPSLAAGFPTRLSDTTWQFKLRDGVSFHNGEAFNAASVVASVNRMARLIEEGVSDLEGFFASLSGAEAVDDSTVNISTAEPDGVLPSRMYWLKIIPASAEASSDLSGSVVGTGPYKFVDWTRGESVNLEANTDYWDGGAPSVGDVKYRFISESGSRLAGLLSGDYDVITNLNPGDASSAPQAATALGQEHPILILDADEGITADRNVRLALNLAVDTDTIADSLFSGFASVDQGQILSPSILGYNEAIKAYPYDPERAAQLINDAGVAGETITLVGESSGRWLLDAELLQAVAGYWEDAGLVVDLQLPEFGAYIGVLFDRENRRDAVFVSSSNDILDADRQFSSYYEAGGIGSSNTDAELAALIDAGRREVDDAVRADLYQKASQIAYDEAYFVWLINNEDIYGLSARMSWQPRADSKLLVKEMSAS
jgi:peptide/nickel transport system substrate-binding protein